MIGWAALILAAVALVRSVRHTHGWQAGRELQDMATRPEQATPAQFGAVEHGGPLGGRVIVRRNGAVTGEEMAAGAYLNEGQLVRIAGHPPVAYPSPGWGD